MSLVELLLATSLLILISASILGGIVATRRAFQVERRALQTDQADEAAQAVSGLIDLAFPVFSNRDPKHPVLLFEGRSDSLSFIAMGDGRSLRGGLHAMVIHRVDGDLVVDVTPTREGTAVSDPQPMRQVTLRRGVGRLRFDYYGSMRKGEKPDWRSDWIGADILPRLISVEMNDDLHPDIVTSATATLRQR